MKEFKIHAYSRKVDYKITLSGKVTIIKGMSGTGKTSFVKAITESDPSYKIEKSDDSYKIIGLLGNDWISLVEALQAVGTKCVFVIDDEDLLQKSVFKDLYMKDTVNLFLVIDRFVNTGLSKITSIPVSVFDIYDLKTNGKYHWLEPSFNLISSHDSYFDYAITEDSSSGLSFLNVYSKGVASTGGKDNIITVIQKNIDNGKLLGKRLLVCADLASFGNYMESLIAKSYYNGGRVVITVPEDYQCFEYLLLKSNFIGFTRDISIDEIAKYFSKENMYEDILDKITEGKSYHQTHGPKAKLNKCYISDCCYKTQTENKPCDKGFKGTKLKEMFKGTVWEDTFNALARSTLGTDLDLTIVNEKKQEKKKRKNN